MNVFLYINTVLLCLCCNIRFLYVLGVNQSFTDVIEGFMNFLAQVFINIYGEFLIH